MSTINTAPLHGSSSVIGHDSHNADHGTRTAIASSIMYGYGVLGLIVTILVIVLLLRLLGVV